MQRTPVTLLRKHSVPKCFGSPWALSPEPTHPPCAASARSRPCAQHHGVSPWGSCRVLQDRRKTGKPAEYFPGLRLTVWIPAQGACMNGTAGPGGPRWQGAEQTHKNTGVYTFWLRLPCRCADGAFQHWQQYCRGALHFNHAAKWTVNNNKRQTSTIKGKQPPTNPQLTQLC